MTTSQPNSQTRRAALSAALLAATLAAASATAQTTYNYTSTTAGGNWSTGTDWNPNITGGPDAAGSLLTKTNGGSAITTTLDVAATIGVIRNTSTGSRHWTIQDDANHYALTFDNTGGVGNALIESNSNTSAMNVYANIIIANTNLDIAAGGASSGSGATRVGVLGVNTITAATSQTINLKANGIKAITVASSIGATGSALGIVNQGAGTGTATISGALGTSVTGITQNSATSQLVINGDNSAFTGDTIVTVGKLSIGSNYTMSASSDNAISLTGMGSPVAGTNYGQILVTAGTTTFGGDLVLNFTGTAVDGSIYDLFTTSGAGTFTGDFESVSIVGSYAANLTNNLGVWSGSNGGFDFSFSQATGDFTITASAVPEPSAFAALAGVAGLGFAALRRRRRA